MRVHFFKPLTADVSIGFKYQPLKVRAMKVPTKASLVSVNFGQFTSSTKLIKPKLSCDVPSPTQHHSFYRNLPIYIGRSKVI